jgi:Tfp pilus assembly protein PilV
MHHDRAGTSLCEVLLALLLLSATAAWGLSAAAAAERTLGNSQRRSDALHRAQRTLADLQALPCDSSSATRSISEPRWEISAQRSTLANVRSDDVQVRSQTGDTVTVHKNLWCD